VYSGPGVSPTSVAHTLTSLRTLLSPNYSVQTVTASALTSHPWTKSCALLVIPGGRDVPYTSALKDANRSIRAYVEGGGSFLGFCAGAYYASQRVEWEAGTPMEVVGDRELGFYPGICEGCVYPGFQYQSEEGARPVKIRAYISHEGENIFAGLYYNGGGHFVDAASFTSKGVRILAVHADEDGEDGKATAVVCDVGLGRAILWNIHIEFPFTTQPALACLSKISPPPSEHLRSVMEKDRWTLLRHTLDLFGLNTTKENPPTGVILSPQHMSFSPYRPGIINAALPELQSAIGPHLTGVIEDIKDTFRFHPSPDLPFVVEESKKLPIFDMSEEFLCSIPKHIIIFKEGAIPSPETTPLFNHIEYYKHLASAREQRHLTLADPTNWASGEILLYGETVTSTQTLLDK
jgi:biotin--protein ligase